MIEEIRKRLKRGYCLSLYGTRELLYGQMEDDINSLLILFDAQKRVIEKEEQKKLIVELSTPMNYISKGCIEYLERKYGININRNDLDNFLNRER